MTLLWQKHSVDFSWDNKKFLRVASQHGDFNLLISNHKQWSILKAIRHTTTTAVSLLFEHFPKFNNNKPHLTKPNFPTVLSPAAINISCRNSCQVGLENTHWTPAMLNIMQSSQFSVWRVTWQLWLWRNGLSRSCLSDLDWFWFWPTVNVSVPSWVLACSTAVNQSPRQGLR